MTSPRLLPATLAALAFAGLVFSLWPGLDIWAASLFFHPPDLFIGQGPWGDRWRRVFSTVPFLVLGVMALLYVFRRLGLVRWWAPNGAGLVMMALSLAIGPGLIVNVGLKDHSHRPRPYYLKEFGGPLEFRPFWRFDGGCARNCSFASGEGASATWLLAPALLAPPPLRPAAVAAALVFAAAASGLRMAFGGHFLSDTVFAGLLTWLTILVCWRVVARFAHREPGALPRTQEAEGTAGRAAGRG